jgi:uncharacterized protein (TIGR01732 family)
MTEVVGFGRQFAFIWVLFILLVIILTGICVTSRIECYPVSQSVLAGL